MLGSVYGLQAGLKRNFSMPRGYDNNNRVVTTPHKGIAYTHKMTSWISDKTVAGITFTTNHPHQEDMITGEQWMTKYHAVIHCNAIMDTKLVIHNSLENGTHFSIQELFIC